MPPTDSNRGRAPRAERHALPDQLARLVEPLARGTADPLRRIRLAWGRICGMPLARHIEPLRLEGATLHVGARGAVWRDAVFHQRSTLLANVRRHAPKTERIWLHTLEGQPPTSRPAPTPTRLTARTEGISDHGLRMAMEGLLATRRPDTADDG